MEEIQNLRKLGRRKNEKKNKGGKRKGGKD